jgi:hypothetical protein
MPNQEFHEKMSSESYCVPCGWTDRQTDRQTDMMKLKIVFHNFYLDAPKNH